MKLHNIAIASLSALALGACSDYLEVDAPSQMLPAEAFTSESDANTALNGVYAQILSSDTYGEKLISIYSLNTDVDFNIQNGHYASTNGFRRYEADPDAGDLYKAWSQFYAAIEAANIFIDQMENSPLMDDKEKLKTYTQMLGEAKVIRAMNYHDLIWMFGDVPMSLVPSYNAETLVYPVTDRAEIIDKLIADLEEIAPEMSSASTVACDRISKEMAWAMIARLAQTAAGYTLRPEGSSYGKMERMNADYKKYYEMTRNYCDSVISSGNYTLSTQLYHEVFTNECNGVLANNGDVIFEIPFGTESTGAIGYIHGPKMDASDGTTAHNFGQASSSAQLNAFYRFSFDDEDMRRDYLNQLWYYTSASPAVATFIYSNNRGRTIYNGKWSKLWVNSGLGPKTKENTGINYPYMRYTDVLLMYAEAVNECEGLGGKNGAKAVGALRQVRERAFRLTNPAKVDTYIAEVSADEDTFRKAVLNERKFEFAGENMRWRDLVRHNLLAENTFWNFWRYYAVAEDAGSSSVELEYVSMHDFGTEDGYDLRNFPSIVYYKDNVTRGTNAASTYADWQFPCTDNSMKVVEIHNAYKPMSASEGALLKVSNASMFEWYDENKGYPQDYFCYSLRGYIYCDYDLTGRIYINQNGIYTSCPDPATLDASKLPVVRYILPYPRNVIARSNGQYTNKYGY
ncbi:MAG: RagB/SusD family nutrient uptake outer membrane protein [Muribaculaceae bacterium]|nr:RagB/SusD family nutrient uptake outer membrane protein [Muribaculaceae bacterium]